MKITIYELLGLVKDGKAPKKIKWEDTIYAYSDYDKDYLEFPFSEEEYQGLFCMKDSTLTQYLNDEVEIIAEQKKIPEKLKYTDTIYNSCDKKVFTDKINEIIDYLKSKGE